MSEPRHPPPPPAFTNIIIPVLPVLPPLPCRWANAMAVVVVEQLLGVDCDAEAELVRQ